MTPTPEHRGVYRLHSRNLRVGVWDAEREQFIGIRQKFHFRFLDAEDLYGPVWGTARPLEHLGWLPDDYGLGTDNAALQAWLEEFERGGEQ